jgi:NAD(P)-dependent dehydrogenase (short-subunit alcohol dehydrogenase family)
MAVARSAGELATLAEHQGVDVHAVSLATPEGCEEAVAATHERLGAVDILVNNAGVGSSHERPIHEQARETWYETMAINLHAAFELSRLTARDMVARGWGRIVVVSSTSGVIGTPSETAYIASKHGVVGLVRGAALDLAPHNITANAVCPGWVRTEMAERGARIEAERRAITPEDVWREREALYRAGRVVRIDEVVATIAFLASPGASGISGEAITVALGDPY